MFLNNRHCRPQYGTFTSVDPIAVVGDPATLDPYVYAQANPITYSDPTGLLRDCECSYPVGYQSPVTRMRQALRENIDDETFWEDVSHEINQCAIRSGDCNAYQFNSEDPWRAAVWYAANITIGDARRQGKIYEDEHGILHPRNCESWCQPGFGDDLGYNLIHVEDPFIAIAMALGDLGQGGGTWNLATTSAAASRGIRTGANSVDEALSGLAVGRSSSVRVVQSTEELDDLFAVLSRGGAQIESSYPGKLVRLPDGTTVGLRGASRSGCPTIDVRLPDGRIVKVHVGP